MRRFLFILLLSMNITPGFCQKIASVTPVIKSQPDYLSRAIHQHKAGIGLLYTGGGLLATTLIINLMAKDIDQHKYLASSKTSLGTLLPLYGTSLGLMGAGGILLAVSGKNEKKGAGVMVKLKMESSRKLRNTVATTVSVPSISLCIGL